MVKPNSARRAGVQPIPVRAITDVVKMPAMHPGFAGPTHLNAAVIEAGDFARTDPFFLMMDDRAIGGGPLGSAHPHAGLETVSFVLSGSLSGDGFRLDEGDVEWMTAGSGIVHGEGFETAEGFRLLQLWIALPPAQGRMTPRLQLLRRDAAPVLRTSGAQVRLYSGEVNGMVSPTLNVMPITLADIRLDPGAFFELAIPRSQRNGFLIVLAGQVLVGNAETRIESEQIGWLDRTTGSGESMLQLRSSTGARLLLYAGEPLGTDLAARGPFIAGSQPELSERFEAFRRGKFPRAAEMLDDDM